ncbi:MAG TPA: hypothetical protein VJH23_03430 [archaeon]|nr:hypothetical protein [archaeon]
MFYPDKNKIVGLPLVAAIFFILILSGCVQQPAQTGAQDQNANGQQNQAQTAPSSIIPPENRLDPSQYAVRQRYFQEAFQPDRENYDLFEKAAVFLKKPVSEMPNYFSLNSESEIFSELPKVPADFSEVAFLIANGDNYAIGGFTDDYYKQPEFYPGFKEGGIKFWTEPDPKYWGTGGYGVYPSEQSDMLSLSGRSDFSAVAFFYSGYGVQTYQGVTIIPSSETLERFEVEITPNTFLLESTFPKFKKNWAQRIEITGKVKPGTPPGDYELKFLVVAPPKEKKEEWKFKYRNIYFDAASSIAPSGAPIKFTIKVTK